MPDITIHPDLSSRSVREDGKVLPLAAHNPVTQAPFASEDDVRAFIALVADDDRYWTNPPTEPATSYRTRMSRPEFKMLFTLSERLAVRAARADESEEGAQKKMILDDFFELIEDDKLQAIEVDHPQVQEGLDYLVSEGLLTLARKDEISLGVPVA